MTRERRRRQRRGGLDRRGNYLRRFTDRRRHTPAAFPAAAVREIQAVVTSGKTVVNCPSCTRRLNVPPPEHVSGTSVWEVFCPDCHKSAMVTGRAAARVLVVDDEPIVRDALNILLARAGHDVIESGDAQSALDAYEQGPIDVALIDVNMPGMDGTELIRRLLRRDPDAKVIAMAGRSRYGAPDPLKLARRFGAVGTVRKPFTPADVLLALDGVLDRLGGRPT